MKLCGRYSFLIAALPALAQSVFAQPASHWRAFKKSDGLAETPCISVTLGASGNLLVRHAKSVDISVFDGYEVTIIPGPGSNRQRVYESPGGQVWTVASEGLEEFREGEWALHRVPEIAEHVRAGRTNEIALLPVRQGRVLILLPDRLIQLDAEDPERTRVELLRRADQTSLGVFAAMTPARDGGLWISGARGFAKIAGPLRNLKADDAWATTDDVPPELKSRQAGAVSPDEINVRKIFDVAVEPGGTVWLATSDGLIRSAPLLWENSTERGTPVRREGLGSNLGLSGDTLRRELQRANPESGAPSPDEITHNVWKSFLIAKNGDVWLGDASKIAWRHQNAWRFFSSTNQVGPEDVLAFAEAPDGKIWAATPDQLWEFDGKNWFTRRGGFARVNGLLCARDGGVWVASADGVHRFAQGSWIAYGPEDGLPSPAVSGVTEDATGRIVANTARGASVFQPDSDRDAPKTFLHSLPDAPGQFREGALVTLAFGGRDKWKLTAATRLLFSHRLDEHEWSPFLEIREVAFVDLPLGKHYFQVRAMDRNGNIDPKPARLEFAVVVPWYRETRLVLVLSSALVIALFFAALALNRQRQLRLAYAGVEKKIAERTRELEIANRELLHSQKMNALGTLAAGIAHDFNNILSIVKGSAQIIEDNVENPQKIRTRVDRIKTVVQQGAGIVEAMLGFSRSSDQPAGPLDVNSVVDDTLKLLGDRFVRETEVRFDRADDLPVIPVARDFVQQVLLNFIFNADEAMERRSPDRREGDGTGPKRADLEIGAPPPARKRIIITTRMFAALPAGMVLQPKPAEGFVAISVRDFGSGITPENLPRIFEPFFTTKALSTKRGTGLGLSMVYELAKKLEAGLTVESVVSEGSTFTLILPVRELPPNPETENQVHHVTRS